MTGGRRGGHRLALRRPTVRVCATCRGTYIGPGPLCATCARCPRCHEKVTGGTRCAQCNGGAPMDEPPRAA